MNIKVKDDSAIAVNTGSPKLKGVHGRFQLIANGVFLGFFQNDTYRASQFWAFQPDGNALIKEVPDRGEKQSAIRVDGDELTAPKSK